MASSKATPITPRQRLSGTTCPSRRTSPTTLTRRRCPPYRCRPRRLRASCRAPSRLQSRRGARPARPSATQPGSASPARKERTAIRWAPTGVPSVKWAAMRQTRRRLPVTCARPGLSITSRMPAPKITMGLQIVLRARGAGQASPIENPVHHVPLVNTRRQPSVRTAKPAATLPLLKRPNACHVQQGLILMRLRQSNVMIARPGQCSQERGEARASTARRATTQVIQGRPRIVQNAWPVRIRALPNQLVATHVLWERPNL